VPPGNWCEIFRVWVGAADPNLLEATIAGAVSAPARTERRLMVI
jgi:hypothetical protein